MVDKTWFEESYREMGECSYGDYVLYKDFLKLLEDKSPQRSASTKDLAVMIETKIKRLEKLCDDTFLKKDTCNYGWAVGLREEANILRRAANLLDIDLDLF